MSYKDITPGKKIARVVGARIIKPKENYGMEIAFEFEEPSTGARETITWVGWLSEKAYERTEETLVNVLGWNRNDSIVDDGTGKLSDPNAFPKDRDVEIVIDNETYEGKTRARVQWVNPVGGSGKFQGVSPEVMNVDPDWLRIRAKFKSAKQQEVNPEKVPF